MPTENSFGTPSLQQKRCYRTCAHPPTVCLLRLLFTVSKVSICLLVFKLPSLFIWVLVFWGFPFLSFSLLLNKRAVVVRCIWSTVDSFRQLMHWSFLHLLFSWLDNAVLYSLLSIHISSINTKLQCKAAELESSASVVLEKNRIYLSSFVAVWQLQERFFFEQFHWGFSL